MDTNDIYDSVLLDHTKELQARSLAAIERINHLTSECQTNGAIALDRLGDQRKTLGEAEGATIRLKEGLDKNNKLQNKFAKLSFAFGTKHKAKKDTKKEQKEVESKTMDAVTKEETKSPPPTYKRRGPRPKKKVSSIIFDPDDGDGNKNRNRNELFLNHRSNLESKEDEKARLSRDRWIVSNQQQQHSFNLNSNDDSDASRGASEGPLLSHQNRHDLDDIQAKYELLEMALDVLGTEVAELEVLSKTMGNEVDKQNGQLERIETNLESSKWQTRQLNNRLLRLSKKKHSKDKKRGLLRKISPVSQAVPSWQPIN